MGIGFGALYKATGFKPQAGGRRSSTSSTTPKYTLRDRIRRWVDKGVENDKYMSALSKGDRKLYTRGQQTFTNEFWNKYGLDIFTEGKTGKELVEGVVERGRFLKEHFPLRSSAGRIIHPMLPFDLLNLRSTWGSGLDTSGRNLLNRLFRPGKEK